MGKEESPCGWSEHHNNRKKTLHQAEIGCYNHTILSFYDSQHSMSTEWVPCCSASSACFSDISRSKIPLKY